MSKKDLKITDKFTPIRTEWKQLYGYPLPVINKDGKLSVKGGKQQTRPADHFDLLLYSEIAGYACCFASPATLADGIGLYGKDADKEVVKRIARGAAVGIIKPSYQNVMGNVKNSQLVLEIDFQRVKELAFQMEEYRNSEKDTLTQREISLRASTTYEDLLNYLQNYIPDYPPNNPPDYSPDHLPNNPPNQSQNHLSDYPSEQLEKPVPEDKPREVKRAYQNPDSSGASAASSMSREERGTGEEDSISSVSHTGKNEVLSPHVAGGHATVKDIFETYVNPLMQANGWTYGDIDAVVEEATGQRQKIKDIATQEQRDEVYRLFEYYSMTREKPEKKVVKAKNAQREVQGGDSQTFAEIFEIAHKLIDEYEWEWNDINHWVKDITGKEQRIKEIETQEERENVAEYLTWAYDCACGKVSGDSFDKKLSILYGLPNVYLKNAVRKERTGFSDSLWSMWWRYEWEKGNVPSKKGIAADFKMLLERYRDNPDPNRVYHWTYADSVKKSGFHFPEEVTDSYFCIQADFEQLSTAPPAEPKVDVVEEQEAYVPSMSSEDNWQLSDIITEIDRVVRDLPCRGIPKTTIAETIKGATGGNANYTIIQSDEIAWIVLTELRGLYS